MKIVVSTHEQKIISYWKVFRLFFVIFSFYLLADALYRWNGFRFYATFFEYLPSVALVSVMWSITAVLISLIVWLSLRATYFLCLHFKSNIAQRLLRFSFFFFSFGAIVFIIKLLAWPNTPIPPQKALIVYSAWTLAAILFTAAIEKFEMIISQWLNVIQKQITIWVWLFGLFVLCSIPYVAYQTWGGTDKAVPLEVNQMGAIGKDKPNIVLITFDGMTTKDMSLYGYSKPTTPFLSEWASKTSVFSGLKAVSNWTQPVLSSLITGKRPWTHRVFQPHAFKIDKGRTENIPQLLKQNGYYNMAYLSDIMDHFSINKIDRFFDITYDPIIFRNEQNSTGLITVKLNEFFGDNFLLYDWMTKSDFIFGKFLIYLSRYVFKDNNVDTHFNMEKMINKFIHDIDNAPPEPYFAWIHIWQPHAPYLPKEPYKGLFGPVTGDIWSSRDRYDELIKYCDDKLKDFIKELTIRNKLENTVIIISSDHGESFEHGYEMHGGPYLYEQVTNIPLIIKTHNQQKGNAIDEFVEQIDIPATMLDLAGIPAPAWMEGRSLVPLIYGEKFAAQPPLSMNFERNPINAEITKGVIAVWKDEYKLIHNLEKNESLLFNLEQDPGELKNLSQSEPEVSQKMLKLIYDNLNKANKAFLARENKP